MSWWRFVAEAATVVVPHVVWHAWFADDVAVVCVFWVGVFAWVARTGAHRWG